MPGPADDLSSRLAAALARSTTRTTPPATGVAPAGTPATPTGAPPAIPPEMERSGVISMSAAAAAAPATSTEFGQRLSAALSRARGETAPAPAETGPPQAAAEGVPVGDGEYTVRTGDCMASIANESGFFWQTIWDDPANAELKRVRVNPNVLLDGDRVTIPEKLRKDEPIAAEQRHRFKRKGEPAFFNVTLRVAGEPIANRPFRALVDGQLALEGTTTPDGCVQKVPIPGNARQAVIVIDPDADDAVEYEFELGRIAPVDTIVGVQARLTNLGFGELSGGRLDDPTQAAIREFQSAQELPVTGQPDAATQARLKEIYGA